MYSIFVAGNVSSISGVWADLMRSAGAASRVFAIMDRKPEMMPVPLSGVGADQCDDRCVEPLPLPVAFRDVSFAYPNRPDTPIANNLSIDIAAGEVVASVGGSGSGKSTCASLLTRLYDVQGGQIMVGGKDIRDYEPSDLRTLIGVVAQEPTLFASTIYENIRYGRLGASREEVESAARAARVLSLQMHSLRVSTHTWANGGRSCRAAKSSASL